MTIRAAPNKTVRNRYFASSITTTTLGLRA